MDDDRRETRRGPIGVLLDTLRYNFKGAALLAVVLFVIWDALLELLYGIISLIQP